MKHFKLKTLAMLTLLAGFMAFGSNQARPAGMSGGDDEHGGQTQGAQLYVDDDHAQCNTPYTSIQAAVSAAHPGDTINVCPGTYHEQVRIDKPLTVRGISVANQNQAILMPNPALPNSTSLAPGGGPITAIILVDGAQRVTLRNLTIDGSTSGINGCGMNFVGVYYRNSSGVIDSLAVRNIKLGPGSEGCQSGIGIFVQSGMGRESGVGILNNSVHDYQKNGITANEAGTEVAIIGNAVSGIGATPSIAQNGIQVGFSAKGIIDSNSVINHLYSLCTTADCSFTSSNILVFNSDGVKVTRNTVGKSQINIYYQGNKGDVSNNTIFESNVFDGIDLVGNKNSASGNSIFNSQASGVYVLGNKNEVAGNTINEAPAGILEDSPSSGNSYNGNRFFNTGVNKGSLPPSAPSGTITNNAVTIGGGAAGTGQGRNVQPIEP